MRSLEVRVWVIFRVGSQRLAIEATSVQELLQLPAVTSLPGVGAGIAGVLNLRGQVIPVVDLRATLGLPSVRSESDALVGLLTQREEDHRRWVDTLEASVVEGKPFTLTLDPTQCAFGKWYASFVPPTLAIESHMRRFDEPHRAIHRLGHEMTALTAQGKRAEALELIRYKRSTSLAKLVELFAEARRLLTENARGLCVVVLAEGARLALTADHVEGVGQLDQLAPLPDTSASTLLRRTGRAGKQGDLVVTLDLESLVAQLRSGPLAA
jgi:chemotaxis signal transduction protein